MSAALEAPPTAIVSPPQRGSDGHEMLKTLLHHLRVDSELMGNNIASPETHDLWTRLATQSQSEMMGMMGSKADEFFSGRAVYALIKEFGANRPNKLAFGIAGRNILVWAEVADDDIDAMRKIVRAIRKANATNSESDIELVPEIVEESEHFEVPPHFVVFDQA